ncbi:MAG: hypothetical protein JRJ12_08875 [Deltaproteobacteria bacterium]|nr:hypothetical protein [Deltaproteobacteria bacterium]
MLPKGLTDRREGGNLRGQHELGAVVQILLYPGQQLVWNSKRWMAGPAVKDTVLLLSAKGKESPAT